MHPNLAISGKMGSGKSTLANLLRERLGYKIVSLASPIYEIATYIANKDPGGLADCLEKYGLGEAKDHFIKLYEEYKFSFFRKDENGILEKTDTFRGLLQKVGNLGREKCGEDVWVKILLGSLRGMAGPFICDDVRNEAEKRVLEENGFLSIRIDVSEEVQRMRLVEKYGHVDKKKLVHPTETALDKSDFSLRIDSDTLSAEGVCNLVENFVRSRDEESSVLSRIVSLTRSIPLGKRDDWIEYFMSVAYIVSLRSTCGSRRVGAVLVDSLEPGRRRILATGYNGYPSGARHCIDGGCPRFLAKKKSGSRFDDPEAPCHAFHAEHNVLNQVLVSNISSEGCILFCTTHPCINCARMIHGAKIRTVYFAEGYPDELAKKYFEEFGIEVVQVDIN